MRTLRAGLRAAFERRAYRLLGAGSFAAALALYVMTLPASFTGGRIGPGALPYLDLELAAFSVLMAALVGLLLPLLAFQLRAGQRPSKASAAGGLAVGVLTPVLCCSPALPLVLGFIATFLPSLVGALGWQLQGFIATHQSELLALASVLLTLAVYQNARSLARGASCAAPYPRAAPPAVVAGEHETRGAP